MPKPARRRGRDPLRRNWFAPFAFIIIVAALLFGISVFFRVSRIEVTGNMLYTTDEIVEAAGIEEGDNLFFINPIAAGSRIISRLPYISEATVSRGLPDRVKIEIRESQAVAYILVDDVPWSIDSRCKLLGPGEQADMTALIRVSGLTAIHPVVGETVAPGQEDTAKVTYLTAILRELESRGMVSDVTAIDMSNLSSPSFDYLGRFTVKMGQNENVDYKMGLLVSAVAQLTAGDSGTIDLSIDRQAHFLQG